MNDQKPTNTSFSDALTALKAGARVHRKGWNGKGMWLALANTETLNAGYLRQFGVLDLREQDAHLKVLPFIVLRTADDGLVPWLASQTDLLAEDWEVL